MSVATRLSPIRHEAATFLAMNAPVTRAAEGLDRWAFTVAEVERMVEAGVIPADARIEVIGGEIVPMSPKGARHEAIKVALARHWGKRAPDDYVVAQETGLRLNEHTYLEPDFVIFRGDVGLSSLKGPDVLLAVEVADSSLDYDLRRKPLVYAQFGVRELWVIDAARRVVHVHMGAGHAGYARVLVRQASDRLVPTEAPGDFALALDELRPI
jgi:Uma2 family endonuclease